MEQCACLTVDAKALAWAEYVIEGEILPNVRIAEDAQSGNGKSHARIPRLLRAPPIRKPPSCA